MIYYLQRLRKSIQPEKYVSDNHEMCPLDNGSHYPEIELAVDLKAREDFIIETMVSKEN